MNNKIKKEYRLSNSREIKLPAIFRHFKGVFYVVTDIVMHTETEEDYVVYFNMHLPYKRFTRPASMFFSDVEPQKYNPTGQKKRFAYISPYPEKQIIPDTKSMVFDEEELEIIRELLSQLACGHDRKTWFYDCCDANPIIDKINDLLGEQNIDDD